MKKTRSSLLDNEAVLLLNKGKRGVLKVIFGRTLLIFLLLMVQAVLLLAAFVRLGEYYYGSAVTASLLASLVVISRGGNASSKITWILLIFLLPVAGIPLYFYVNLELGYRLVRRRLDTVEREMQAFDPAGAVGSAQLEAEDPAFAGLAYYAEHSAGQRVYGDSGAEYLPCGEAAFEEMLRQLEQARSFIFLEYFIIAEGYMWGRILKVLEEKARAGVEVRVMYDGTCVAGNLPYHYPEKLAELGIRCKMFSPMRPLFSTHYNNRDHRKIMVIDGRVAFTGGINLADEYINRASPYGYWKDTAVMVTGRAVAGFTRMFLHMWNVENAGKDDYGRYLGASAPVLSDGYILPYGSSPFSDEQVGETVYLDMIHHAHRYLHVMTPYLILDEKMTAALIYAAGRGVDVKVITPGIPDKKMIFALSRSYYQELLAGGVEVYEYTPGFVHGKMFVSDDRTAVVGSINLDYRSLYLHFECGALLRDCAAVADVERDMQQTLALCRRITPEDCRKFKPGQRLMGWLLRPWAPLL